MKPLLLGLALGLGLICTAQAMEPVSRPVTDWSLSPELDPYLWLEDVGGDQALGWVRERNAASTAALAQTPEFAALQGRLLQILDSKDRIPFVGNMGKYYYNFWRDVDHPRGVWRRTTLAEYKAADTAWDVVLDLDALAASEGENWVWAGSSCLPPKYERCLLSLSRGGADATVVREFDLKTRAFVADGFSLPEAKSDVAWVDLNTLYVGTDTGEGSLTSSGYPRQVRLWTRGTPLSQAELIYEGAVDDVWVAAAVDHTPGFERHYRYRGLTFFTNETQVLHEGAWLTLDKPEDATVQGWRDWMLFELRSDWSVGGQTYVAGSLLAIPWDSFLEGGRSFEVLFAPTERTSLVGYTGLKSGIVLNTLDNVRNRLEVLRPGKKGWTRGPLEGAPSMGTLGVSADDPGRSDVFWMTATDYLTPTTLSLGKLGKGAPAPVKSLPAFFNAEGLAITQHEATSADGTRVPYFLVARADLPLDGSHPTLLYGYGGFEVSLLPSYSATVGAAWLEQGGVYVVANIRGGGEFGPRWHQAALKANRNKAYEDFAAVARDLVARQVTSVEHLGIQGGSNGGLLMGNMLTDYPDLFSAVVCQVPLLDMYRYNKLLAGASWMGEYGDPDKPEEWDFLKKYSPYHKLSPDADYPKVLFMTSTRDDRVHPGHARKMAARMMEQGHELLYYENIEGGHKGAADNKQSAFMGAMAYSFLWAELK